MGGSEALIASVFTQVAGTALGMANKPSAPPDNSAQLAAEREAREEEQRKKEADERRRQRENVTEARQLEQKRQDPAAKRQTTLANGATGLTDAAVISAFAKIAPLVLEGGFRGAGRGYGEELSREQLREMMKDPRFSDPARLDKEYVKKVNDGFDALYPGDYIPGSRI